MMNRHDAGFALTLALLLLAPGIPVGSGFASLAGLGLVIWFFLSFDQPLLMFQRLPSLLGLLAFAVYALLVSLASLQSGSIIYAVQFGFYVLMAAMLLPAYLGNEQRRRNAWRIVAVIGSIYCVGLLVSLVTGPIYPWQARGWHKFYDGVWIPRGHGFSDAANTAGGIAAVLVCFSMFLYRRSPTRVALAALMVAGVLATLSRGAIAAFIAAIAFIVFLAAVRPLLGAPVARVRMFAIRSGTLILFASLPLAAIVLQPVLEMVEPAAKRLFLDGEYRTQDIALRLDQWLGGAERWANRDSMVVQMFGAGFRSGGIDEGGIYTTAHNAYVEALLDFGVVGLLLFGMLLMVTIVRFSAGFVQPLGRFALAGLMVLIVHNGTEVFFWTPEMAVLLVLLMTCGEFALRKPRNRVAADLHPRLVPLNGIGATARDVIPGDFNAIAGWSEAKRHDRRMRAA